jgi:hypothetical protein
MTVVRYVLVKLKPGVPDHGLQPDDRHSVRHRRKQAIKPDEEQSVG